MVREGLAVKIQYPSPMLPLERKAPLDEIARGGATTGGLYEGLIRGRCRGGMELRVTRLMRPKLVTARPVSVSRRNRPYSATLGLRCIDLAERDSVLAPVVERCVVRIEACAAAAILAVEITTTGVTSAAKRALLQSSLWSLGFTVCELWVGCSLALDAHIRLLI